jgi:hypothetical protein
MSYYKCSGCNYSSPYRSGVKSHVNKKNKCIQGSLEIIKISVEITCDHCGKNFSYQSGKDKHLVICKEKLEKLKKDRENIEDKRKIKELEKELKKEKLKNTTAKTINNTTNNTMTNSNNTNTINNYITISLTPYNDPNMEGMQQYLEAAIRKTFLSVPNLIESVHFNKEYPENQNICITNRRTKDAKVFDGKKWKTINKELLLNEIVDTYERELTNYAEEQGKTKFIKEYNSAKKRGNAEKDLKDEVHNVLYDNSEMVNTKIKEVEKLIVLEDKESEPEPELNLLTDSETDSESEAPQIDEYEEFRKHMEESESESE